MRDATADKEHASNAGGAVCLECSHCKGFFRMYGSCEYGNAGAKIHLHCTAAPSESRRNPITGEHQIRFGCNERWFSPIEETSLFPTCSNINKNGICSLFERGHPQGELTDRKRNWLSRFLNPFDGVH